MPRSDDDSWDLLSSVGATATAVAAQRAIVSRRRDPLITDPLAQPLVEALGADYFIRFARGEFEDGDDVVAMTDSIAIRTRYFDDFFMNATEAGIRQAVILASGLDTRAYRLAWPADTVVYEIDQPEVIEFKTNAVAELGVAPPVVRRTLAIDLRDDWPAALIAAGFDRTQPTAWIAEGLLICLPPEAQNLLFDRIDALSAAGSRIGTEDLAGITEQQLVQIAERVQAMRGNGTGPDSPVDVAELWYVGERVTASEYLAAKGWRSESRRTTELFGDYGLVLPDSVVTPFGDPVYVTARRD